MFFLLELSSNSTKAADVLLLLVHELSKKLSVIKTGTRICVEKLPRIVFKFDLLHCSFGILLVFVYLFWSSSWFLDLCNLGLYWYSHRSVKWEVDEWRPECQAAPLITAAQLLVLQFLQWKISHLMALHPLCFNNFCCVHEHSLN